MTEHLSQTGAYFVVVLCAGGEGTRVREVLPPGVPTKQQLVTSRDGAVLIDSLIRNLRIALRSIEVPFQLISTVRDPLLHDHLSLHHPDVFPVRCSPDTHMASLNFGVAAIKSTPDLVQSQRPWVFMIDTDSLFSPQLLRHTFALFAEFGSAAYVPTVVQSVPAQRRAGFSGERGLHVDCGIYAFPLSAARSGSLDVLRSPGDVIRSCANYTLLPLPMSFQGHWLGMGVPSEIMAVRRLLDMEGMSDSRREARSQKWVAFDLDGTVLRSGQPSRAPGHLSGTPAMYELVTALHKLTGGRVGVFTARVSNPDPVECAVEVAAINDWWINTFGFVPFKVTATKDLACELIIDDRAINPYPDGPPPTEFNSPLLAFVRQLIK